MAYPDPAEIEKRRMAGAVDVLGNAFKRVCQEKEDLHRVLALIVDAFGLRCDLDAGERRAIDAGIALLQRLEDKS